MNGALTMVDPAVREFCRSLAAHLTTQEFTASVDRFAGLKVLVMGDAIFDRYSYLRVQGLTSKNRIISGRFLQEETQCGGALAVYRHVRQFTDQVKFLSLVGTEPWVDPFLRTYLAPEHDLILREPSFTTIIKQRFVEPLNKGKEMSKLFSVNYLNDAAPAPEVLERLRNRLTEAVRGVDAVLLLDFGHGMMQGSIRQLVQEIAPYLALNCQTNSYNHGFNIISRQYQRADAFSLDALELMLACGQRRPDYHAELEALRLHLTARQAWLTRGVVDTIGVDLAGGNSACPPFENDVVDTVGAGDAFFSVAALAAVSRLPIDVGTFIGQLAGAQAVKIVGNAQPISKATLLETGRYLLDSSRA